VLSALFCLSVAQAEPLHLLFWEEGDIREGQNVVLEAHPFPPEKRTILLAADPGRPSLWYNPTDVMRVGDEIRVYYQRVEKSLENYTDQRTWCLGFLAPGSQFVLPDLNLLPQSWEGPANVVLQRSPHQPTWGGFNVFQMVGNAEEGYRVLYWDQPETELAGALLAESIDGIHWTKDESRAVFTEHNDAYSLVVGFESAGCRFAGADSTELPLRWEKGDLASIVGRTVHLRFLLNNARVYSLR